MTRSKSGGEGSRPHDAQVRRLLGGPRYRRLFEAVRRRLELDGEVARSVTLTGLDQAERTALAGLLGRATIPGPRARIVLSRLDEALRGSRLECGVVEVLEALGGPLVDRRARREASRLREEEMWSRADNERVVATAPALRAWLGELRSRGLLRRAAGRSGTGAADLLGVALGVVKSLPSRGVLLPVLAADLTGDAHALDHGRPLGALVLRAAAHMRGWPEVPRAATGRRRLWAEVGVLCDPLSSHVLVLGLRPHGDSRLARNLREAAEGGEPVRVTLRELGHQGRLKQPARQIFVCENPGVVAAAADRVGPRSAPLVCTEGVPTTAVTELLRLLSSCGTSLRVQCDFDWGGLRIGNLLHESFETTPWRFTTSHYRRCLQAEDPAMPLRGTPRDAAWDPQLRGALEKAGRALFEEQLLDDLLDDLERNANA